MLFAELVKINQVAVKSDKAIWRRTPSCMKKVRLCQGIIGRKMHLYVNCYAEKSKYASLPSTFPSPRTVIWHDLTKLRGNGRQGGKPSPFSIISTTCIYRDFWYVIQDIFIRINQMKEFLRQFVSGSSTVFDKMAILKTDG